MVELEIHIDEPHVIVNVRGTRLTITYHLSADGRSLVEHPFWTGDDRNAPISLSEFRSSAWRAAQKKADEIGWIGADSTSKDKPQNRAAESAKLLSLVTRIDSGRAMQVNSAQAASCLEYRRIESAAVSVLPVQSSDDRAMIECAAQALFEYVFAGSERLDAKHLWMNCDEATKEGFRGEARVALQAVWPVWSRGAASEETTQRPMKFASS